MRKEELDTLHLHYRFCVKNWASFMNYHNTNEYFIHLQTAAQRPDPKDGQQQYEDDLKKQIEMKKLRAAEEKQKQKEEEAKLEKRIQEQQERMKKEYDEEVAKKRAKEEAVSMWSRRISNHWKLCI